MKKKLMKKRTTRTKEMNEKLKEIKINRRVETRHWK